MFALFALLLLLLPFRNHILAAILEDDSPTP
jgi:hypothetical protein